MHQQDDGGKTVLAELRIDIEGETGIEAIRELELAEAAEIREAARLVRTVAAAGPFRGVQELSGMVLERLALVESRGRPAVHEIEALLAGVRALVEARVKFDESLVDLTADLARQAGSSGGADDGTGHGEWAPLMALASEAGRLRRDRAGVVGVLDDSGQLTGLGAAVQRATFATQLAFIAALASRADDVAAAGRKLRQLHAEAAEGRPVLIGDWPPRETGAQMSITPEDLSIESIGEAMRLTRTAKGVAVAPPAFPVEVETLEEEPAKKPADENAVEPEAVAPDVAATEARVAATASENAPSERPDGEKDSGADRSVPPPPVDVGGLLRLARSLNDDLARAWSDGLERAQTEAAIAKQRAAITGAIGAVARLFDHDRTLIGEFPPSPARRAALEASEDLAEETVITAQLLAIDGVVGRLRPLLEPTIVHVTFGNTGAQTLKRFWESGAFAHLAGNLDLLGQLLEPPYRPQIAARAGAFQHLRQAHTAWTGGDPVGCLLHAVAGLGTHIGIPLNELEARIAGEPTLQHDGVAEAAAAGVRVARRIMDGETSLALVVLLAPLVADSLADLILPTNLERAMTGDELFNLMAEEIPFEKLSGDEPS